MTLTFLDHNKTIVASIAGRLDSITSTEAQAALLEKIEAGEGALVLDLSALEYLSSAGLRALLTAVKKASGSNRRSAVVVQQPHIREILQISGFHSLVSTYDTIAEATAALEG